ncbi:MAG TPA: tRNA dihydrouridine(20/20a) synthase DusA [Burkholderiales bacterium]|nr:tRNA dihydrouridine(20/20a) synthase DusA [Burkholderiales bacterium]
MVFNNHIIAVAPMVDWTDRHFRYFMRQITKHTRLYTEMIVDDAIIHGNLDKLLGFNSLEHPLIVQLGGSNPAKLALASKKCQEFGYDAINLNIGCPSDRVKLGKFGACLMHEPQLVADCISAMQDAVKIPVTIKQRIGLDYESDYQGLYDFVAKIASTGCNEFIIHARNAILNGLSPKQNREIPPLKYEYVYQLKKDFPNLSIIINGGIKTVEEINLHLGNIDGVMIGREAYYNPYLFSTFDEIFFNDKHTILTRYEIAKNMSDYLIDVDSKGILLHHVTRHMIGLYHGLPNAKLWRYTLTNEIIKTNSLDTYFNLLINMENVF